MCTCRICEESFGLSTHLIHHMQRSHVKAELPYFCHICSYRYGINTYVCTFVQLGTRGEKSVYIWATRLRAKINLGPKMDVKSGKIMVTSNKKHCFWMENVTIKF